MSTITITIMVAISSAISITITITISRRNSMRTSEYVGNESISSRVHNTARERDSVSKGAEERVDAGFRQVGRQCVDGDGEDIEPAERFSGGGEKGDFQGVRFLRE